MGASVTPAGTAARPHLVKNPESGAGGAEIGARRSSTLSQNSKIHEKLVSLYQTGL
jgi:hypothetical protein